tara:strand:- start:2 stop:154 length:153 start_codon:yes stop_codon:yes gene_type:complete
MTKLQKLLNSYTAAYDIWATIAVDANADAAWDAWIAYLAELKKTQENSDD